MSYRLEYQWACWRVPSTDGQATPRFVIGIEGGDNNVCDGRTGKRARSWDVCMLGTASQVLKATVYFAGSCEGGSLKPGGTDCRPEAYIRRIRRLIESDKAPQPQGRWYPNVRVPEEHPLVAYAQQLGVHMYRQQRYGNWEMHFDLTESQRDLVFDFAERFPDLPAWRLAAVGGMPSS